jgi:hypothetical protein
LLRHTKAELLVDSAKGLANFETVKKSSEKNTYKRSKGCLKYWTVLRFILEMLSLKAKHSWSGSSFNDLLHMLACCFQSQIKYPPTPIEQRSLSVRLRWMWKEFMHVRIIVFCIVGIHSKTWTSALFVLQVVAKTIPVIVVATFKVQVMGIKGRGRVQGIVPPLLS